MTWFGATSRTLTTCCRSWNSSGVDRINSELLPSSAWMRIGLPVADAIVVVGGLLRLAPLVEMVVVVAALPCPDVSVTTGVISGRTVLADIELLDCSCGLSDSVR